MREIKFRAWRFDDKKMYKMFQLTAPNDYEFNHSEKQILMQYTGLKDKFGKEIYEGDILKLMISYIKNKEFILELYYEQQSAIFIARGTIREIINSEDKTRIWEVIGNIYENPELLEESLK
jgi:uncharacterized phage protein (TIGR01671 family)